MELHENALGKLRYRIFDATNYDRIFLISKLSDKKNYIFKKSYYNEIDQKI